MTWLFAALWKLPASNSLTRTAEAQECVYGNVGGPKRPRSKLSLSRKYRSVLRIRYSPPPCCCQIATQEGAFEIVVRMPIRGSRLPQETWIAGRRIPRAGECAGRQSPQAAIEAMDPA